MATAAELRAEVARLRAVALSQTYRDVRIEIQDMVEKLERRARALGDGVDGES